MTPWIIVITISALALAILLLDWFHTKAVTRRIESISTAMKYFVTNGLRESSFVDHNFRSTPVLQRFGHLSAANKAVRDLAANAELMASAIAESKGAMLERERNHLLWFEFLAHDLASPLARISKRLDVLEYGVNVTAEHQKRFFDTAQLEIAQLVETLRTISQSASLESSVERDFIALSLEPLLQETIDVFEFDACQKGIKLKRHLDVDRIVRVEKTLIRRALGNLISNAIRYTPNGGDISVHAEENGHAVEIRVRDTGTGIPSHELSRVFEFGFRGEGQSRPARFGPRGLGLALVQKVAEMHHGDVRAVNLDPLGTEFVITLPIED
jgi:signal transduction histidine kinase